MKRQLLSFIRACGDTSEFLEYQPLSGGSISQAFRVDTRRNRYFVKCHKGAPVDLFHCEADGLERLRQTQTLRIPCVLHVGHDEGDLRACLVLEWIDAGRSPVDPERLGRGLASLHQHRSDRYGLDTNNYIGMLPQSNKPTDDWLSFYREQRLGVQVEMARRSGKMGRRRSHQMERLLERLEEWIPRHPDASLLHGDLWSGNYLSASGGEPCLIDPAVAYGDRELELAFTELFGGFPARFYSAYNEAWPMSRHYDERKPLYQLYYLLVHLNLFGESYGAHVDRILDRYTG